MTYTDGRVCRYAVMRGKMRGRYFDAHSATVIAVYEENGRPLSPADHHADYQAMTAKHATQEAPPVRWQA
jgi:hypothetical protein